MGEEGNKFHENVQLGGRISYKIEMENVHFYVEI